MKKTIFLVLIVVFALSSSTVFASGAKTASEKNAVPAKTENILSEAEMARLNKRVEEIRAMDKTEMTNKEKSELRKELKGIKENVKKNSGGVYIGVGTLILIILLVILLV